MAATKKTVLITGSTRGIGLAFAEYYVKAGWNVIGTARANSNTEQLAALSPFKIVTMDTGDEATMLEAAHQLEGIPIDLLINNAGIGIYTTFVTASKDAIMKTLEVNALGPFLVTRALVSNLKLAAKVDQPAVYHQQQRGLRAVVPRLRDSNITVVAVNPGYVATDMSNHQGVIKADDAVAAMDNIVSKLSLEDSGKFFNADPAIPESDLPW
ncbi:C-factor [Phytophthora citrophthora]|uniref:C-factor n=1 Tax=Phytophthora citrophthora TaxID=4793 RepID=A0AAD9LPV7_9STRA|nr:C-factor [Phytophthora citrophthora]